MGRQFRAQPLDEFRIHEIVVIGNAERDLRLVFQFVGKAGAQAIGVFAFHAKNLVSPADVTVGNFDTSPAFCSGGAGFIARMILEKRFRRGTAPLVA